jgi:hypothetical protein
VRAACGFLDKAKGDSAQVKGLADVVLDTHVYNGHGTTGAACSHMLSTGLSQPCQPTPSGLESPSSRCRVSTWPLALHRLSSASTFAVRPMPSKACSSSEILRSKRPRKGIWHDAACRRVAVDALLTAQHVLISGAGTMHSPCLLHAAAVRRLLMRCWREHERRSQLGAGVRLYLTWGSG